MYKHIYIYIYIHPTVQLQLVFSVYKCVYIYIHAYTYIQIYIYVFFVCVVDSLHMAFMSHSLVCSTVSDSHISDSEQSTRPDFYNGSQKDRHNYSCTNRWESEEEQGLTVFQPPKLAVDINLPADRLHGLTASWRTTRRRQSRLLGQCSFNFILHDTGSNNSGGRSATSRA